MNTLASRRSFLQTSAVAAATIAAAPTLRAAADDKVRLGIVAAGGRAGELSQAFSKSPNAKIVAVADPDQSRAEKLAGNYKAKAYADLRKMLENPEIDAVVVATCNHWHVLAAIWALQAGKHVYVEKPLAHNQWEGQQLVALAKKSGKVVQIGTQQRSDPLQAEAKKFLHDEKALGEIRYVQANRLGVRGPIGRRKEPLPIPAGVNYDLWLGPAAEEPIYRDNLQYDWHWDYNTGNGEMGNWGVHVLDDVRNVAYRDSISLPKRIVATGGRIVWDDAGETPNVHFALFETDSFPTIIALSNLESGVKGDKGWKVPVEGVDGPGSGYVVACEGGYYLGQRGSGQAVDRDGKTIKKFKGGDMMRLHTQNFLDAVMAGDQSVLNGGIVQGHYSTGWCNLANIAVQDGERTGAGADVRQASDHSGWQGALNELDRNLKALDVSAERLIDGPVLHFDAKTERFTGEHSRDVNGLLRRQYRKGYEVPEIA